MAVGVRKERGNLLSLLTIATNGESVTRRDAGNVLGDPLRGGDGGERIPIDSLPIQRHEYDSPIPLLRLSHSSHLISHPHKVHSD